MKNNNLKMNKGYAILFTVVVVGIISMITIGLSNAAYKQMILSSVARDSTTAFYQSDIASECALYADNEYNMVNFPSNPWTCAPGYVLTYSSSVPSVGVTKYNLDPQDNTSVGKCFRTVVTKTESAFAITTKIDAKGYNICDKGNSRTVERAIEVNY